VAAQNRVESLRPPLSPEVEPGIAHCVCGFRRRRRDAYSDISTWRSSVRLIASGIVLLVVELSGLGAWAATRPKFGTLDAPAVMAQLQRHYHVTTSFSAKFAETVGRAGAPPLQRSGFLYFHKPGKLRWEFEQPEPETIVSDGTTIYDYDPGLNQVVETPLSQAFKSQAAAAFLLGAGDLRRDFTAAPGTGMRADGLIHLRLTPKAAGDRIDAGIDPKTYNILSITIHDPLGNQTELHFSDIALNRPLNASLFEFRPPSGADIVGSQQVQ
jgi:outer membrane lipoprotein carrier protein